MLSLFPSLFFGPTVNEILQKGKEMLCHTLTFFSVKFSSYRKV